MVMLGRKRKSPPPPPIIALCQRLSPAGHSLYLAPWPCIPNLHWWKLKVTHWQRPRHMVNVRWMICGLVGWSLPQQYNNPLSAIHNTVPHPEVAFWKPFFAVYRGEKKLISERISVLLYSGEKKVDAQSLKFFKVLSGQLTISFICEASGYFSGTT